MSQYQRVFIPGGTFFFTVVTHRRKPIFNNEDNIQLLREAMRKVKLTRPFDIDAIVILPDHLHCIWQLPENDSDYSGRWREIKKSVSKHITHKKNSRNERDVWQRRFWEHVIRDDQDWRNHMDYIHYNPVKHGYVKSPIDWQWSSFKTAVSKGLYDEYWGSVEPSGIVNMNFE